MSTFSGLFELRSPQDLFRKLEHDYARLEKEPLNQYAAFDFFVTAEHLIDWLYPKDSDQKKRKDLREGHVLLQICSHLANGSKHFQATATRHKSIDTTQLHRGGFSSDFSRDFDVSRLRIYLEGDAANKLGTIVDALDLAKMIMEHAGVRSFL